MRLISVATLMCMHGVVEATNNLIKYPLSKELFLSLVNYLRTIGYNLITRQNLGPAKVNFRQCAKVLSWFSDLIRSEMQNLVSFLFLAE